MIEFNKTETTLNQALRPYLVFQLNGSDYAIRIEHVREIITTVDLSPVPGAPSYLAGVVNLRGRILPMIDLRKRFQLPAAVDLDRQCFVILMLELNGELVELGVQIDSVSEVIRIGDEQIDSADGMTDFHETLIFRGVAKTTSGIKLILDSHVLIEQLKSDVRSQYATSSTSTATQSRPEELAVST